MTLLCHMKPGKKTRTHTHTHWWNWFRPRLCWVSSGLYLCLFVLGTWSTHLTRLRGPRRRSRCGSKAQSWLNGSAATTATSISLERKSGGQKEREQAHWNFHRVGRLLPQSQLSGIPLMNAHIISTNMTEFLQERMAKWKDIHDDKRKLTFRVMSVRGWSYETQDYHQEPNGISKLYVKCTSLITGK